jgi:hypothetical protein
MSGQGLRFRVRGYESGLRVYDYGFMNQGLGFRV